MGLWATSLRKRGFTPPMRLVGCWRPMATTILQLDGDDLRAIIREELSALLERQNNPRFLRVPDAAQMLGVTEWALRAMERRGQVTAHRVGSRLLFDPDELAAFVRGEA